MTDISEILMELKKYGLKNNIPNISEKNALFLRHLLKQYNVKHLLEIGTANGYSTLQFAQDLSEIWGTITTIEFSQLAYESAQENFARAGVEDMITPYFWDAREILPLLTETYDGVFIDGLKKASLHFLQLVWDKTQEWWVIIIDDVIKFRDKMADLYEYVEKNGLNYTIVETDSGDGVMIIER